MTGITVGNDTQCKFVSVQVSVPLLLLKGENPQCKHVSCLCVYMEGHESVTNG